LPIDESDDDSNSTEDEDGNGSVDEE